MGASEVASEVTRTFTVEVQGWANGYWVSVTFEVPDAPSARAAMLLAKQAARERGLNDPAVNAVSEKVIL